jgi:translocator protein
MKFWTSLALTGAAALAAAVIGTRSAGGDIAMRVRYQRLDKPSVAPPPSVFGPVWGVLYPAIAVSGARVLHAPPSPARSRALALWAAQMTLNAAWTPLFFGERRAKAALVDIGALLALSAAYAWTAREVDRPAAALAVPYVGWIAFASALNGEIVRRNAYA